MYEKLKDILREVLIVNEYIDVYNLSDKVINWSNTMAPEKLEEGDEWFDEPQDLENYEILLVTDDKFIICCGGDWQEPMTIEIEELNGVLTVTSAIASDFEDGMTDEQVLALLER